MGRWDGYSDVVYFMGSADGPIKIGIATNPATRLGEIQTGHPYDLMVLAGFAGDRSDEKRLHVEFKDSRLRGEWFERDDRLLRLIDCLNYECSVPDGLEWTLDRWRYGEIARKHDDLMYTLRSVEAANAVMSMFAVKKLG